MSYIIEPHIQRYIDSTAEAVTTSASLKFHADIDLAAETAADNAGLKFRADMEHGRGLIIEEFQTRLMLMGETIDSKIRETTREVIREECMPRFDLLETEMCTFRDEMKLLRKDSNRHHVRLTRLERAAA